MNKVTEVTTKSELLARAKEAKPDCIIADVGLVNWQDDTGSEIIGLAITGNIPMIFDFSQVQNENLKKILESRGTTLAEFKIALIEKVLNEE
jgi:CheY-like chemotaxis protein